MERSQFIRLIEAKLAALPGKDVYKRQGYGRPFPPKFKDIIANRGCTAGELGMMGKRQPMLDTLVMPLAGANYDNHGIQYFPCPLLTGVKGEENRPVVEEWAARHASMLSGITSLGYDTPGYGYGDHDADGTPIPVSYTHLDVYKRQIRRFRPRRKKRPRVIRKER